MVCNIHPPRAPFIVGMGRSGTTLLRLMLDKHPLLSIPPETHFIGELIGKARDMSVDASTFLKMLVSSRRWHDFELDAGTLQKRLVSLSEFSMADGLRSFYAYYAEQQEKVLWGDKTPPYLGLMCDIHKLLPEAFFIHLIRDGRDSALSYRGLWFGPGNELALHARTWSARIADGRSNVGHLDGRYLEVRYERLVTDTENVLKEICAALGLDFDHAMLDYHVTARDRISQIKGRYKEDGQWIEAERIRKIFERTATPPDQKRIGRWRTEMTEDEQMSYERVAGPLLNELGYETRYPELWKK